MGDKPETMTTSTRADDATYLGHPKGLFYIAFTEAWERFP